MITKMQRSAIFTRYNHQRAAGSDSGRLPRRKRRKPTGGTSQPPLPDIRP